MTPATCASTESSNARHREEHTWSSLVDGRFPGHVLDWCQDPVLQTAQQLAEGVELVSERPAGIPGVWV
jgi:hypothetical protein